MHVASIESDHRGEHFVERQAGLLEIRRDPGAQLGQDATESREPVELRAVTDLPPAIVVAVLLATARTTAGCLNVTVRQGQIQTPRQAGGTAPGCG